MASRAGNYPQVLIKQRRKAFLRKQRWRVAVIVLSIAGLVGGIAWLFPEWSAPGWAAVLAVFVAVGAVAHPQVDGTYHLVLGRDAERWTSNDLRKKLGRGWHVIDGLVFWHGDADHIVVGPTGVYVVEVKNTESELNLESRFGRERADEWVRAVNRRARSTRLLLRRHGVGVESLVVIWGSGVMGLPQMYNGVKVLHGRDLPFELKIWKERAPVLNPSQLDSIKDDLVTQRSRQGK